MKTGVILALLVGLALGARGQIDVGGAPSNPQASEPPGSVSGRVINAATGEPVRGAVVNLQNYTRGGGFQSAATDGSGAFSASGLPPGEYVAQVNHPGFQGILGLPGPAQFFSVASGEESSGVTLRLTPGGRISGRVVDDGDEPVTGCPVWALGAGQGGTAAIITRGNAITNDKGEYTLDSLAADRYILYARCQESLPVERLLAVWRPELIEPAESWQPVFFPDSSSLEGAQWLTVLPGSEAQGVDFRLRPTPVFTVSGTIAGAIGGAPGTQPSFQLIPAGTSFDGSMSYGGSFDATNSTFRIQMVPPGSYRLMVFAFGGQVEALSYASAAVTVGKTTPQPLHVQMRPGLTLPGRVERPPSEDGSASAGPVMLNSLQGPGRQGPNEAPIGYVQLVPMSPMVYASPRQAPVRQDGTFQLQGLTPGRYKLTAQISGAQPLSVESVQIGQSQVEHGVIELTDIAPGPLHVRTVANRAQISASLAGAPDSARGQWAILAIPADQPIAGQFPQLMCGAGKSGDSVRAQNLSAGKYAFVAVEMAMSGAVQNERLALLLRDRVEPVEILAGQDQTVQPRFFTSAEIEKLALAYLRGEAR